MGDILDPKPIAVDDTYHPQDAIGLATRATVLAGTAGLFAAAVRNTVAKENVGAFGVFTRFGSQIGTFGRPDQSPDHALKSFLTMLQPLPALHINS